MERKEARRLCARSGHSICTPPRARWLLYLRPDVHPLDAGIRWRKSERSVGKECPELSVVGYRSFCSISSNCLPRYEKRNRRDPVPFFVEGAEEKTAICHRGCTRTWRKVEIPVSSALKAQLTYAFPKFTDFICHQSLFLVSQYRWHEHFDICISEY